MSLAGGEWQGAGDLGLAALNRRSPPQSHAPNVGQGSFPESGLDRTQVEGRSAQKQEVNSGMAQE